MSDSRHDRRYNSSKWRRVRLAVLQRDHYRCQLKPDCPVRANVADHIRETVTGLSDADFYGMHNLQAACQGHNKAKGFDGAAMRSQSRRPHPLRANAINRRGSFFRRGSGSRSRRMG